MTWQDLKAMNTPTEWRARFARNRWVLAWAGFVLLFVFMVGGTCAFWHRPWLGNFLSVFGTGIAVVLAILVYVHGNAANARATREQMDHMQALTQKQIEALAANTDRQIQQYSSETLKVVSKLGENSLLLAELLKRELEEAIGDNNANLEHAERAYQKAQGFLIGRTQVERATQLQQHQNFIQRLRGWGGYIQRKYNNLTAIFRDSL